MSDRVVDEEELNLLRACAHAPDDDLPRLVLADWYDEHARPELAGFVRLQVAAAAAETPPGRQRDFVERADALLAAHAGEWERHLRPLGAAWVDYERGLPAGLVGDAESFARSGGHWIRLAPTATRLRVCNTAAGTASLGSLAGCPHLAHFRRLHLDGLGVTPGACGVSPRVTTSTT